MHIRLSAQERANSKTCLCPRGAHGVASSPPARVLSLTLLGFVVADGVFALFLPWVALIVAGLVLVLGVFSTCWYLIRGHTFKCSLLWGFAGWIFLLIDGIVGGL